MRLEKVRLKNYCQYKDFKISFKKGVNLLKGKNGRGKSNLMDSVFFGLTGDSLLKGRTRTSMLSWGETSGFVELSFAVNGGSYTVKRALENSSVLLKGPSVEITRSKEATEFISTLLKTDSEVLKISSFMPQAGAAELVFGTQSERQRAFSRLFRLNHLEGYRVDLQKEFNKIPVYTDLTDLLDRLRLDKALLKAKLREIAEDKSSVFADSNRGKYDKMVAFRSVKYSKDDFLSERSAILEEVSGLEGRKSSLEGTEDSLVSPEPVSQEERELYDGYREFEGLCGRMLEAVKRRDGIAVPEEVTEKAMVDLSSKLLNTKSEASEARKKAELWRKGVCSECKAEYPHTPEEIEEAAALADKLERSVSNLARELEELSSRRDAYKDANARKARSEDECSEAMEKVRGKSHIYEGYSPDAYKARLAEHEKAVARMRDREKVSRELTLIASRLGELKASLASLEASGHRPDDYDGEFIVKFEEALEKVRSMEKDKVAVETALRLKSEEEAVRTVEQEKCLKAAEYRRHITDLRALLHTDCYPKLALAALKEILSVFINRYLENFETPFTVDISPDLEFICDFGEGHRVGADEALSGGQRAMLLVSCRLAVAEMLAEVVELLTFDEPGAALDVDAENGLAEAFMKARKCLSGRSVQMLVASHGESLDSIADNIINL